MALHNKRVPRSPLKQWVLYQEVGVCTGIAVSKKLKIIEKITLARSNYWMLKCALMLRDQQTAVQPCLPQGTVYCKNNDNDNDNDNDNNKGGREKLVIKVKEESKKNGNKLKKCVQIDLDILKNVRFEAKRTQGAPF